MKILFVCNQNQNRSKTAELLFKAECKAKSAGLYNEEPVTKNQLDWADLIVVMEDEQRTEIARRFPLQYIKKRILSWDIPDRFTSNQPELIKLLKKKEQRLLQPFF